MHDKYKRPFRTGPADIRVRRQIALEAARRLLDAFDVPRGDTTPLDRLQAAGESDYYAAKRKAAAVLGHRIRPGDLPSDDEVRDQVVVLQKQRTDAAENEDEDDQEDDEGEDEQGPVASLAETIDRFAVYRLRLQPLEGVKLDPVSHPEGDALYHSLQVFHLARDARPYDEEFLLAALLHDVGKATTTRNQAAAAVDALRGSVTERTLWLIAHLPDSATERFRTLSAKQRREIDESEYAEDLKLLRECDEAGRACGVAVDTLEQALEYIRGLEAEHDLDP